MRILFAVVCLFACTEVAQAQPKPSRQCDCIVTGICTCGPACDCLSVSAKVQEKPVEMTSTHGNKVVFIFSKNLGIMVPKEAGWRLDPGDGFWYKMPYCPDDQLYDTKTGCCYAVPVIRKAKPYITGPFKLFEGTMQNNFPVGVSFGYDDINVARRVAQSIVARDNQPVMIHDSEGQMVATIYPPMAKK